MLMVDGINGGGEPLVAIFWFMELVDDGIDDDEDDDDVVVVDVEDEELLPTPEPFVNGIFIVMPLPAIPPAVISFEC